jgi:hypothetical protein
MRTGEDSHEDEYHDHYDSVFGRYKPSVVRESLNLEDLIILARESKQYERVDER